MNEIERTIRELQLYVDVRWGGANDMFNLALTALREKAEREKGCEFCRKPYKSIDSGKDGKEKSILYMGGNSPYAQLSKQYLHYMDVAGRMDLFEVKFCPMCGRRLEAQP